MKTSTVPQKPLVSVVIPVFNKCELTQQCLESIAKVGTRVPFELIVIDNASSDATPQLLDRWREFVRVIRNSVNLGFAGACNQGAAAAAGAYILFLNNDTVALEGWLDALVDELEAHPRVVAAGSKLLYRDGSIQHAGVLFARETRSPFHPYRLAAADDARVNKRRELQAVTAACMLIRARWFADCGGFSERFKTGYEDLDLCLTIRRRGGTIVYQPKSVLFHLESQTPGRLRHETVNRALFYERWSDQLLSDEDDYYFRDDLRILRSRDEHGDIVRAVRFGSDEERSRWSLVAECQRHAASGEREEMFRCLRAAASWPADAAVRSWAGSICHRFGLEEAARTHFTAALALEPSPALRVHAALSRPALPVSSEQAAAWESPFAAALADLRATRPTSARAGLESALLRGAPAKLVLPGLWEAARKLGDKKGAEALRSALAGLPHVDPSTVERLLAEAK